MPTTSIVQNSSSPSGKHDVAALRKEVQALRRVVDRSRTLRAEQNGGSKERYLPVQAHQHLALPGSSAVHQKRRLRKTKRKEGSPWKKAKVQAKDKITLDTIMHNVNSNTKNFHRAKNGRVCYAFQNSTCPSANCAREHCCAGRGTLGRPNDECHFRQGSFAV